MRGERGLDGSKREVLAFPAKAAASAPSEASSATLAFSLPFFCASIASARFVSSLARVQQCSRVCPFLFLHVGWVHTLLDAWERRLDELEVVEAFIAACSDALGCLLRSSCKNASLTFLKSREPGTRSREERKLANSAGNERMRAIMANSSSNSARVSFSECAERTFCRLSSTLAHKDVRDSSSPLEIDRNSSRTKKREAELSWEYVSFNFFHIPTESSRKSLMSDWMDGSTWE